jgi:HK97 family phage major capsid protein
MTPAELRRKASELRDKIKQLVTLAESENRELTDDEQTLAADLRGQIDAFERRAKMQDELLSRPAPAPEVRASEPIEIGGKVEAVKTQEEKEESFGDFLRCVAIMSDRAVSRPTYERTVDKLTNFYRSSYAAWDKGEKRDIAQASGVTGGYTVPTGFYAKLMEVASETAIVRPRATVIPMAADTVEIPIINQTTAPSAGSTSFFGGVTAAWSAEAASISEVQPTFQQAKMTAHEITAYTEISRTVLQNSAISLDALTYRLFGGAIGWFEDYAFLRGNGIGKPLGVQTAAAFLASGTARGSATAISFLNARQVWVKVLNQSRMGGVWVVSQSAESAVLDMAGTANSVFVPSGYYITGSGNAAGQSINYALLGRPVLVSEKLPALNSAGDFGFYDFSQYLIGDRGSMEIAASEHFKFQNNQMAYRIVHRVAGMPWLPSSITLADASTTVSPFVYLTVQ